MEKLERAQMNAVMGGAPGKKMTTTVSLKLSKPEKSWYEKAWDEIKSWF